MKTLKQENSTPVKVKPKEKSKEKKTTKSPPLTTTVKESAPAGQTLSSRRTLSGTVVLSKKVNNAKKPASPSAKAVDTTPTEQASEPPTYLSQTSSIPEHVVEIPQIQKEISFKKVSVPQIIEKEVIEYVTVDEPYYVERNLPIPYKTIVTHEFAIPQMVPKVQVVKFPVYIPRFVEVPVPVEAISEPVRDHMAQLHRKVAQLTSMATGPSLCELEKFAVEAKDLNVDKVLANLNMHSALQKAWSEGRLKSSTQTYSDSYFEPQPVNH